MPKPGKKIIFAGQWPSQNIAKAKTAYNNIGVWKFIIPQEALKLITFKTFFVSWRGKFEYFFGQIEQAFASLPADIIEQTIDFMEERIDLIITQKGQGIKCMDFFSGVFRFSCLNINTDFIQIL